MPRLNAFQQPYRASSTRLRAALRRTPREVPRGRPHGRSLRDFLPLLPAEMLLLQACKKGEIAKVGETRPSAEDQTNPDLKVRAPFLRFLLLGGDYQAPVHERGVRLQGAYIVDRLDLGGCEIPSNITLKNCLFLALLNAQDAQVKGLLTLEGSGLSHGLNADRLQCAGGVFLRYGFQAKGGTRLLGAEIGGGLDCIGGQFDGNGEDALSADGIVVKGSVFFKNGFHATGEVRLLGAEIGGSLSCGDGQFDGKEGSAILADRVTVGGSVFLNVGFQALGGVRLLGAQIGNNLDCSGGQFDSKGEDALSADGVVVKGNVFLDDGFQAKNKVRLRGALIGGSLNCSDGQFDGKGEDALSADGIVVKGNVFFRNGFRAKGSVGLLGAQIGGGLDCSDGQFDGEGEDALSADGAVVKGDVFFNAGFRATGKVRLLGAQIDGDFNCIGSQFDGKGGDALSLERSEVLGGLFLRDMSSSLQINAGHAQVGVLVDEWSAWAKGSTLDGFRYGALGTSSTIRAAERLDWLRRQTTDALGESEKGSGFRPQPWKQLQRVLRDMGHAEEARQIGMAFEVQLRKTGLIGSTSPATKPVVGRAKRAVANSFHWCFGFLAGYGYRPMRLLLALAVVWLVCGVSFWLLALPPYSALGPSDPLVFQNTAYRECVPESDEARDAKERGLGLAGNWFLCGKLPAEYSTFSPLAYSLDIILPLVDLGQEKAWGALVPTPNLAWWQELLTHSPAHIARWLIWFETIFGWVASLLLVGIVSGFARRTEE